MKLLNAGADPNTKAEEGETALVLACCTSQFKAVEKLLNIGVDVNEQDSYGCSALFGAIRNVNMVALLIKHGAIVDIRNKQGTTPLLWTASHGYLDCYAGSTVDSANCLIDKGADVNARDSKGRTPLYVCVNGETKRPPIELDGIERMAMMLIENGADVNALDNEGTPILLWVIRKGFENVVKKMIDKKVDVDAQLNTTCIEKQNLSGFSALHCAIYYGYENIVHLLLDAGANPDPVLNGMNMTPLHLAVDTEQDNLALLLIRNNAKMDIKNGYGEDVYEALAHSKCKKSLYYANSKIIPHKKGSENKKKMLDLHGKLSKFKRTYS